MKYFRKFANLGTANAAGQAGMHSPHVDAIGSVVNMVRVSTSTFTCSYNGVGVVTDVTPVDDSNKLFYTTTDGQITNPNPSTETVSNWFEPAQLVSNYYSNGQGVMQFDRSLTTIVDGEIFSDAAFMNNSTIMTISNSNISYIGNYTFMQYSSLQSVNFPAWGMMHSDIAHLFKV